MDSKEKKRIEREILERKEEMCKVRDTCADEYTRYIQLLLESENDPVRYEYYLQKIADLEPRTRETKESMRSMNRELARLNSKKLTERS